MAESLAMDLGNRRWTVSAVVSLFAAGLLAFATFLPLFIGDSYIAAHQPPVAFHAKLIGWNSGFGTGYLQLLGAAVALIAGVLTLIAGRKGAVVMLVISGGLNLGVAAVVGSVLARYFETYPASDGPEGKITADLGVGFWCLAVGLLLVLMAVIVVLPAAGIGLVNRRWGTAAALSLVAAALLALAAFLPQFHTEWYDRGDQWQTTANAWGVTTTMSSAANLNIPSGTIYYPSGYPQVFGAVLTLVTGLLALVAVRRTARGRAGSMVLLLAAGPFNIGFTALLVVALNGYFKAFPASNRTSLRAFEIGLGSWCLFLGVFFSLLATTAVLTRKPEPALVPVDS